MEYTEQQKAAFKTTFARRRRNQLMFSLGVVALVGFFAFARNRPQTRPGILVRIAVPTALAASVGLVIFSLQNWRCPACDGYLGRVGNARFCPKCGVALR